MENQIAYCEHCGREVPVVDYVPEKKFKPYLVVTIISIILVVFILLVENVNIFDDNELFMLVGVPLISSVVGIIAWLGHAPSATGVYCEICGSYIRKHKIFTKNRCSCCDTKLKSDEEFCPKCGKKRPEVAIVNCKKCNANNSAKSAHCVKCGAKL
jgi:hypothetical protein